MKNLTVISRLIVGILFIISGLIKANDPLGFSYKLDEYFVVFNIGWLGVASLYIAMAICIAEVVLGLATLLGVKMKTTSWLLLLLIVFFTFLTFYSAYYNKVTDCGCFGDAIKLTPWQSFYKDIILLFFIFIIFIRRHVIKPLFNEKFALIILFLSFVGSLYFTIWCYRHLPIVDFRPYAIGKNIPESMKLPEGAPKDSVIMIFKYRKGGKLFEFKVDELPEDLDSYEFVDRIDKVIREGVNPLIHDFSIADQDGNDYTEDFLINPDYNFILIAYDLEKTNKEVSAKINVLVDSCHKVNINFIGLTASSPEETDLYRHAVQAMYDFYYCDATTLKTIIRSNPGLVLLKGGTVIDMWHYNDFPNFEEIRRKYLKS